MAETKYIRVALGDDEAHNFVLYTGMNVSEAVGLFRSGFWGTLSTIPSQNIWIIGLENTNDGSTISLSDMCEYPLELSSKVLYQLVLSSTPPRASLPTPPAQIEDTLSMDLMRAREEMFPAIITAGSGTSGGFKPLMPRRNSVSSSSSSGSYSSESDYSEEANQPAASGNLSPHSDEAVVTALTSFVGECEGAQLFTREEAGALKGLLNDESGRGCDAVVRAAYLVCYASGRDAQLLYAVLKDVAGKQLSAEGREEHVAQEELVDMVEALIDSKAVDHSGAIFLLELIVRKAQPIVKIYQNYAQHCDYERVKSDIANLAKDYTMQDSGGTPPPRPPPPPLRRKESSWEVDSMSTVNSDDEITTPRNSRDATSSTLPMTRSGLAAALSANAKPFQPQGRDSKASEESTAASVLEAVVTRAHLEGALSPGDAEVAIQLIKSRNALLFNAHSRFADEPAGLRELVLAVVRAERARRQAVENAHASHDEPSWASLPKPLLNLLQVAESQGLVQHDDAILVCNAFIHNFELVHAGWEVYEDEGDEAELLDTILRVLRSGRLHEQMAQYEEGVFADEEPESYYDEEDEYEAGKRPGEENVERLPDVAISVLRTMAGRMEASGALTPDESDALIELAEDGDPALHACFEVYAADSDLEELLSSLQSLARKEDSFRKEADSPEDVSSGGDDVADESDEDNDSPAPRGMAAELNDLLKCLLEDGKLSTAEVKALQQLIENEEPRVLAAYDSYVMFRDVEDLIDTLERIARLSLQGSLGLKQEQQSSNSQGKLLSRLFPAGSGEADDEGSSDDYSDTSSSTSNSSSSVGDNEEELGNGSEEQRKEMLLLLLERGALNQDQVIVLMRKMLIGNDKLVNYTFDKYNEDQDVQSFIQTLRQLSDPSTQDFELEEETSSDSESSHESDSNDKSRSFEEDEEGNEGGDDAELGQVFMEVVRGMELSEAESMALRLCIARDDPNVRAALEVFKVERDVDDLRDTLKRLSRRTVESMMRELQSSED